jgi:hypothetical protein
MFPEKKVIQIIFFREKKIKKTKQNKKTKTKQNTIKDITNQFGLHDCVDQ